MPKTSVTAQVETDIYRAVKAASGLSGKSMAQWIEDALREALPPQFRKGLKS